ncbi:flagellar basal-body rod protein FlgF [Gallaecimonas xiamenensis]|uniref:Flagellar basal-body rod protein FlgF n=1 Tax=Gallaecimonas xiamenensis 3-C-1 TaxID=745411 RepID=K2IY97_9GAMM|nr:flagellar basal-body rod protein FlgF [Gallaecimonas xiamenensis]EKE75451.1 flagellar basal body rod protein FlgF [Gallaecimonas xiamenensis 3-C-1]
MDRLLYLAMSGANQDMHALTARANNLANAKTTGFKADFAQARAMQVFGDGMPTRVFAMSERPGQRFDAGSLETTGRTLDVAVEGEGWLAVQGANGTEGYTRAGNLRVSDTGLLETAKGELVLGEGDAPIAVPLPYAKLEIAGDGTISVLPQGAPANAIEQVNRIKLVNPEFSDLVKGEDGLFRQKDGTNALAEANVRLLQGALEGSNVNPVEEMTALIDLQRQFELQLKMMKTAEDMDASHNNLLRLT